MTKAIVVGVLAVLLMTGCAMQRYSSHLKHGGVLSRCRWTSRLPGRSIVCIPSREITAVTGRT